MAVTALTDLDFNTQAFSDVFGGVFNETIEALSSGLVSAVPAGLIPAGTPGQYVNIPQWDTLANSTSQITDTSSAPTPGANGTWKTYAPYLAREQAWGASFLSMVQAAEDAEEEVAKQVAQWAARFAVYLAGQAAVGGFATALNTTHSTGSTYEAATITFDGALAAKALLTDNSGQLDRAIMHGKVHSDAVRDKVITTLAGSQGATDAYTSGMINQIAGSMAYQNDLMCTAVSSVYPTYFGAPGSIIFHSTEMPVSSQSFSKISNINANGVNVQLEAFRSQASGGADVLTARMNIAMAIKGLEWQSTANPAPTDLATGSNWAVSTNAETKDIKIVRLTTL